MAACKDCIHNNVCSIWREQEGQDAKCYAQNDNWECDLFEDKSKLVKLPLKVDQRVYIIILDRVVPFNIISITFSITNEPMYKAQHGLSLVWVFNNHDIEKNVFFSRQIANKVLEKMKEEKK